MSKHKQKSDPFLALILGLMIGLVLVLSICGIAVRPSFSEESLESSFIIYQSVPSFIISGMGGLYGPDPTRRTRQLLFESDETEKIHDERERFWFLDQPDYKTPFRVHSGVI